MKWNLTQWYDATTGAPVTDMSHAGKSVTEWFPNGAIGDFLSMTPVWPATGLPVGALTLEQTNEETPVVATVPDEVGLSEYYSTAFPEPNPDGSAGRKPVLLRVAGAFQRWAYARTSGGTGANCVVYCAEGK